MRVDQERQRDALGDQGPEVCAMVVGYNLPEVTLDCLHSLQRSDYARLRILYVDNGSEPEHARRVVRDAPGIEAVRIPANEGPVNGFNVGLSHAMKQTPDSGYVMMFNNDTVVEPDTITCMVRAAEAHPRAGAVIPKIYHYDHPDVLWSAGTRVRAFPPGMVMVKSRGKERPGRRYPTRVDVACYCVAMFRPNVLREVGLLDASYSFFYEDYDHSLRVREAGYDIVLAEDARMYHKISLTGGAGTNNPRFWHCYGSSVKVFYRKHGRDHPWATGPFNHWYLVLRSLLEGHTYGIRPFLQGMKEGATKPLAPVPNWDHDFGAVEPLTEESASTG